MKLLADCSLPGLAQAFPKPFELSLYQHPKEVPTLLKGQQILLCRSTLKVDQHLLKSHSSLRYVATASSGTDHIDSCYLHEHGIKLIDAKGSNAVAVADYVISTLAFLQKYRNFAGSKAVVIGLGEVGTRVASRLSAVGMEILCYDPPKQQLDPQFVSCSLEAITQCDLITIHANLQDEPPYPSRNLFDDSLLRQLKSNVVIINASRGGIVNETALLNQKKPLVYCTDVYENEPAINPRIVALATLCTPHIAGHSIDAKYTAVAMLSQKLHAELQLPCPSLPIPVVEAFSQSEEQTWQALSLAIYNPVHETETLKASNELALTFQSLRKAHQRRYDFCTYPLQVSDSKIRRILGF